MIGIIAVRPLSRAEVRDRGSIVVEMDGGKNTRLRDPAVSDFLADDLTRGRMAYAAA